MASPVWQFGVFTFESEGPRLLKEGQVVPLEPKALETLRAFLEQPGQLLDKNTLMARIWPDVVVEETGLARNISLLRKALEDDAATPRYLETVPRKGYRFIAEVTCVESQEEEASRPLSTSHPWRRWRWVWLAVLVLGFLGWQFYCPSPHAPRQGGRARVAALAFGAEPGLEPLNVGWLELLDAELANRPCFQVVSPDTVRRYEGFHIPSHVMGRVLGLDFLLEGQMQTSGERVYLSARLVDVHSGAMVWSANHDYSRSDFPAKRPEAARRIAEEASSHVRP